MPELGGGNQTQVTESGGVVQVGITEGPGSGLDADTLDGTHLTTLTDDITLAQDLATTANNTANFARTEIAAVRGGSTVLDGVLKAWVEGEDYEATSRVYSDGVLSSATVVWPDGSAGSLTVTASTTTGDYVSVDAFEVTHADSGKKVVQAEVTRHADGAIGTKPALTVEEI